MPHARSSLLLFAFQVGNRHTRIRYNKAGLCLLFKMLIMDIKLKALTVQLAAQQLQAEAQALVGGSLWVDPDKAGQQGTRRSQLWGVVVLIADEYLKQKGKDARAKHAQQCHL